MCNFRLISLISSVCKIITKFLSLKLGDVLELTISENQIALVVVREILDVVLVANKVLEGIKRECIMTWFLS